MILSVIFLLFHLKHFFSRRVIWYSLAGMAIPLLAFFVFKHFYAPSNDIVGGQNAGTFKQLFIWNRYKVIWTHFVQELDEHFYYAKVGFALYVLICIIEKKWPDKNFIMLTLCLLAYLMIYVLTPASLEWHLNTSLSRLMLQLMPAMMFVFAQKFSGGKISFVTKKPF